MNNLSAFSGIQLKWPAALAGIFCLTLAIPAPAATGTRPCADDAAKFCKDVPKGEGRIANCLKEHKDELSPACKNNIAHARKQGEGMKKACHEDAQKLCKDIQPGGGRIVQCLKQHEGELSPACKAQVNRSGKGK